MKLQVEKVSLNFDPHYWKGDFLLDRLRHNGKHPKISTLAIRFLKHSAAT